MDDNYATSELLYTFTEFSDKSLVTILYIFRETVLIRITFQSKIGLLAEMFPHSKLHGASM